MRTPAFSWSKSRNEHFFMCRRQYWFNYYGYNEGWLQKTDTRTQRIYYCKNLKTLDMLTGINVHETIKSCLTYYSETGELISSSMMFSIAQDAWKRYLDNTLTRRWRNNKRTPAILDLSTEGYNRAINKTRDCLRVFLDYVPNIDRTRIKYVDNADIGWFYYKGARVYAIVDLMLENPIEIYDWKTGDEDREDLMQLFTYGLWALNLDSNTSAEDIKFKVVNLSKMSVKDYIFSSKDYIRALAEIEESMDSMLIMNNAKEDDFVLTNNLETCKSCAFREVCPRYATA